MKKSLNSGFILAESLIGFGVLATCVLLFLAMQTASLTQSAALQEKAQILRVLYEEVQNHSFDASTITYTTRRQTVYQVRFLASSAASTGTHPKWRTALGDCV